MKNRLFSAFVALVMITVIGVAFAQLPLPGQPFFGSFIQIPMVAVGSNAGQCPSSPGGSALLICGDSATGLLRTNFNGGTYNITGIDGVICTPLQGTSSVGITTNAFTTLGSTACKIPANTAAVNKEYTFEVNGVYTNAAASLLEGSWLICQTSGACGGTTVRPAGCDVASTNQANNLTNGQFNSKCRLTIAAVGATGNAIAKSVFCANLGAATSAVLSCFQDTSTAVSANFDTTQDEFVVFQWKFQTGNAGNSATAQDETEKLTAF